jgi:hypothetical protein
VCTVRKMTSMRANGVRVPLPVMDADAIASVTNLASRGGWLISFASSCRGRAILNGRKAWTIPPPCRSLQRRKGFLQSTSLTTYTLWINRLLVIQKNAWNDGEQLRVKVVEVEASWTMNRPFELDMVALSYHKLTKLWGTYHK